MRNWSLIRLAIACVLASPAAFGQAAPIAPIEQAVLARDAFSTGILDRSAGALGSDLWRGADPGSLALLLGMAPPRPSGPAIGAAMRRVLLSAGEAPAGSPPALGGAKLIALARAGFAEEARQVESLAAPSMNDPARMEAMATADILSGDTAAACDRGRRVTAGLENPFWVRLRVVCYAASNELDAAELALGILRESERLGDSDEEILAPLAAGGLLKAPAAPVDAVHYAALKAMKAPIDGGLLEKAHGGVIKAVAKDPQTEWSARIYAANRAAAMGVLSAGDLRTIFDAAPANVVKGFAEIKEMNSPELLRDRTARIAAEISGAVDFPDLVAKSMIYSEELRGAEGVILSAREAAEIALARIVIGDAVGAERWLAFAGADAARGAPDNQLMRFISIVEIFSVLDPAAADRVSNAANVSIKPPRGELQSARATSPSLAPVVAAAIAAAHLNSEGEAALAAIAASDDAAAGDPVAEALIAPSLRAAGLGDLSRRRDVERAIAALFRTETETAVKVQSAAPVQDAGGMRPRLKPKRSI